MDEKVMFETLKEMDEVAEVYPKNYEEVIDRYHMCFRRYAILNDGLRIDIFGNDFHGKDAELFRKIVERKIAIKREDPLLNQFTAMDLLEKEDGISAKETLCDADGNLCALVAGSIVSFTRDEYYNKPEAEFRVIARNKVRLAYLKKFARGGEA